MMKRRAAEPRRKTEGMRIGTHSTSDSGGTGALGYIFNVQFSISKLPCLDIGTLEIIFDHICFFLQEKIIDL